MERIGRNHHPIHCVPALFCSIYWDHPCDACGLARRQAVLNTQKRFWIIKNGQERLNYNHPYLLCLIDGIADDDLRISLQNLRKAKSLTPELIAETMRINVQKVISDPNLSMYLALDGFYQPLINRSAKK